MNALSFRLFSWYSSEIFALIVIILTSVFIIGVEGVSPLITTLFSSVITLLITYNNRDYNGPPVALNIKPGAYNLDCCGANTYNLPI